MLTISKAHLLSLTYAVTLAILLFFFRGLTTSDFLTYVPLFQDHSMSLYTWQEPIFWLTGKLSFSICPDCDPRISLLPLDFVIFYIFSYTILSVPNTNTIRRTFGLTTLLLALPILSSYQVITGALNIYKQLFGTVFFIVSISAYANNRIKQSSVFAILAMLCHNIFIVFTILLFSSMSVRSHRLVRLVPGIIASLVCYAIFYFLGAFSQADSALGGVQSSGDSRIILIIMFGIMTALASFFVRGKNKLFPFFLSISLFNFLLACSMGNFQESVIERVFLLSVLIQSFLSYVAYLCNCSRNIAAFILLLFTEVILLVLPVFLSPVIPVLIGEGSL